MWSPKGTTLRVIRCPTLQVSQFLFPGQRSDTFLTDHVSTKVSFKITIRKRLVYMTFVDFENETSNSILEFEKMNVLK